MTEEQPNPGTESTDPNAHGPEAVDPSKYEVEESEPAAGRAELDAKEGDIAGTVQGSPPDPDFPRDEGTHPSRTDVVASEDDGA